MFLVATLVMIHNDSTVIARAFEVWDHTWKMVHSGLLEALVGVLLFCHVCSWLHFRVVQHPIEMPSYKNQQLQITNRCLSACLLYCSVNITTHKKARLDSAKTNRQWNEL